MTLKEEEVRMAFYTGVDIGQKKLALYSICGDLGIDWIEGGA